MKVFVAIPQITSIETINFMREHLLNQGLEAVFAADVIPQHPRGTPSERTKARFNSVREAMKGCDLMLANLTPFLGVEPDPDVTFQLGYMAAQQRPCFTYSNVSESFFERVKRWNGSEFSEDKIVGDSGKIAVLKRDRDNMRIEDKGIKVDGELKQWLAEYEHFEKTGEVRNRADVLNF